MKHRIGTKLLAVLLCILSLTALIISGLGTAIAALNGMYERSFDRSTITAPSTSRFYQYLAESYLQRYIAETKGQCPLAVLDQLYDEHNHMYDAHITIYDGSTAVASTGIGIVRPNVQKLSMSVLYPAMVTQLDSSGAPMEPIGKWCFTISDIELELDTYESPTYSITIEAELTDEERTQIQLLNTLYRYRFMLIAAAALSLGVLAVSFVLLCCTAGRSSHSEEVRPGGLNRIPLDLYGLGVLTGCGILVAVVAEFYYTFFQYSPYFTLPVLAAIVFLAAAMVTGFAYALVAQIKVGGGFWWHHSISGWCLHKLRQGCHYCFVGLRAVFRMLPLIWQWIVGIFVPPILALLSLIGMMDSYSSVGEMFYSVLFLACAVLTLSIVLYAGYGFGVLFKGVKAMAQGQLYYQIPLTNLIGPFRDFAMQLNAMGNAMQMAVSRQMKSERMKTELITNVSHDIKTPLTSIINYVDLLKKPHTQQAEAQYLEVLDRQSLRLKKLIDDLMEMSKANSGTLTVELSRMDAAEAVNQALGEFADKLDAAGLTPVFRHPEEPVMIQADGRLLWRVLSNVLSNAVKYALPNTRLYLDLTVLQGNAVIAIKNISRDQLNVNADELMERFVRGDLSRNTEGSGLGLNIARSLVELQKGQMHLMVDGDLFKVTLVFPCC